MQLTDRNSDFFAAIGASLLLIMTVEVLMNNSKMMYEVNTGIICALVCFVPTILRKYGVFRIPAWLCVMITVVILLHGFGVLMLTYDTLQYYDTLTHTASSIVVTFCVFFSLMCVQRYDGKIRLNKKWTAMMVFMIMMTFSTYWEIFEYIVDLLTGTCMQYSPFDTIRDMLCNTLGALIASWAMMCILKNKTMDEIVDSFELNDKLKELISR